MRENKTKTDLMVLVSTNTYHTIANGQGLAELIRASSADIARVTGFQIPDMSIIHGVKMRK